MTAKAQTRCFVPGISSAVLSVLTREVAAWEERRNALGGTVNWRFTTADARIKLRRLYPIH